MGSSRDDPPWAGESLEDGAEALEFPSPASEWGALRAGKAGFAPSRRAFQGGWRLGDTAGRAMAALLGGGCWEAASLGWGAPAAGPATLGVAFPGLGLGAPSGFLGCRGGG